MNTKPNEPFNAEEEKEAYNQYVKKESTVNHKGIDVVIDYKTLKKDLEKTKK